jgi:hypothetical protein
LDSLWAIPKGYWKATGKCPNTCCQPIGEEVELPSGYWQNRGKFPSLFSEVLRFCLHLLKDGEAVENLKTLSSSSSIFALSNHTTYSQTQTGATDPLNIKIRKVFLCCIELCITRIFLKPLPSRSSLA